MISKDDRKHLIALCDRFINSGDDVTLAHLLDALNTVIPDANSQDMKDWSGYMEELNEVWVCINKEGETLPWPTVCVDFFTEGPDGSDSQHSLPWTLQAQPSHRSLVLPSSLLPIKLKQAYGPVFWDRRRKGVAKQDTG